MPRCANWPNPFEDQSGDPKRRLIGLYGLLIAANLAAWLWAVLAFSESPKLLGLALLAYLLGLRHAVDADHIAAIDNVVRKLMQEGKQPLAVGLFFALGHSTIVVLATIAITATTAALQSKLGTVYDIGGVIGTTVSALFLLIIGCANLLILRGYGQHLREFAAASLCTRRILIICSVAAV